MTRVHPSDKREREHTTMFYCGYTQDSIVRNGAAIANPQSHTQIIYCAELNANLEIINSDKASGG